MCHASLWIQKEQNPKGGIDAPTTENRRILVEIALYD
jgi:hypothetical protein